MTNCSSRLSLALFCVCILIEPSEAKALGYGGISLVRRACGLSRKAIRKGIRELETRASWPGRIRRPGAGRKRITEFDPELVGAVGGDARGRGTGRSRIAPALDLQEH